jgi:hypothetical protein
LAGHRFLCSGIEKGHASRPLPICPSREKGGYRLAEKIGEARNIRNALCARPSAQNGYWRWGRVQNASREGPREAGDRPAAVEGLFLNVEYQRLGCGGQKPFRALSGFCRNCAICDKEMKNMDFLP